MGERERETETGRGRGRGTQRRHTEKEKQESQSAIRSENPDCLKEKKKKETTKPDFRWNFSYLSYIRSHAKYSVPCKSLESRGELQIG